MRWLGKTPGLRWSAANRAFFHSDHRVRKNSGVLKWWNVCVCVLFHQGLHIEGSPTGPKKGGRGAGWDTPGWGRLGELEGEEAGSCSLPSLPECTCLWGAWSGEHLVGGVNGGEAWCICKRRGRNRPTPPEGSESGDWGGDPGPELGLAPLLLLPPPLCWS